MSPRFEAIIFDLDGTVADNQWMHGEIEVGFLAEYGIKKTAEELSARFGGINLEPTFIALFAEAHKPNPGEKVLKEFSERKKKILESRAAEFRHMPGVLELTSMLLSHNVPLAIASGSTLEMIELVLKTLDMRNRFKAIASAKELAKDRGKPSPDVFLLAAKRLGVDPHKCLVIGDAPSDVQGSRAAGMHCVALWKHQNYPLPRHPRLKVVSDLREIPREIFFR